MKRLSLLAVSMLLTCTLFAADIFLRGSVNGWGTSDDFKFATSDNVVYTLEKSFDLFGEFKFADANWGADNYGSGGGAVELETPLKLVAGGGNFNCGSNSYKVTKIVLNLLENSATIYGEGGELEITSRTVAGDDTGIFGTAWDPENTANDMVKDGSTWKLVKENVSLVSGTEYLFKIVANHAWGVSDYPEDSSNASFTVSQSGAYDVNFEYDETTNTGKAYATKKSEPTTFDSYILVGDKELFIFDWTPSPMGTDMFTLETTDGIHYSKTINNVPLTNVVPGEYAYGFSKNGSLTDVLFKADRSHTVTVEAATYNITVALTVAPGEEPEAKAELTKVLPGTTYYITGNGDAETDWCCGAAWNPAGCAMESGYFTRDLPAGEYKFKITQGDWEKQSWGYDAVDASQSTAGYTRDDDGNVVFTLDKKSTVAVKFDGSKIALQWTAKDEPVPGFDTWTLVGDMPPFPAAWTVEPAFDLQTTDGVVYTLVADDVDMTVEEFQYGFRKNNSEEYAPLDEKYTATLTEGTGSYQVSIKLDFTNSSKPVVEVNFKKNVTPTYEYYIAGNGDGLNGWTCGITWDPAGCCMAEGQYKAHVQPGTYEFKVTDGTWDNTWGIESVDATQSTPGYEGTDNVKFTVNAEANISVSFDGTSIVLTSDVPFGEATITDWSVVGDEALGLVWTPATTTDDMALVGGAYQLVKTGLVLQAGDYDYKFTANHQWGVKEFPESGNLTLSIPEDGTYKVTFRLNATGTEGSAEAEKQVDPGFDTWTLVGDMPPFPAAWTVEPAFDLQTTDGVVYTLVADDVDMTVEEFQYGFRKNNSEEYAPLDEKYTATLTEGTGSYQVSIKLDFTNSSKPVVEVNFKKNVTPTYEYYIAGNGDGLNGWTCGITWDPAGCCMAEGQYKAHVQPGTYEFKVTDGTWDNTWGIESVDATQSTPGYEGTDNVKFSVSSEANITVSFDGTSIILLSDVPFGEATITSWTAVGEAGLFENAWTPTDESNDMQFVGGVYQLVKTGLTLEAKDYLYKFTANHTWSVSEIPSGNATLTIEEAGTYKVTFSLNPATGEYSAVPEKETPTSADEAVEDSIYATSGTVYCSTPFEVYNLVGQNVTAQNGSLFGIYIVKTANTVKTVSVK